MSASYVPSTELRARAHRETKSDSSSLVKLTVLVRKRNIKYSHKQHENIKGQAPGRWVAGAARRTCYQEVTSRASKRM